MHAALMITIVKRLVNVYFLTICTLGPLLKHPKLLYGSIKLEGSFLH